MITEEIKREVITRYNSGEKLAAICHDLRIEYKCGYGILKRAGIELVTQHAELNNTLANNLELIRKLRTVNKLTYVEIGEIFNCSDHTIKNFCVRHNIIAEIKATERKKRVKKDKYKLPALMTKLWNSELVL